MNNPHREYVFMSPRYFSATGYLAFPAVLTVMLFYLPPFSVASSRFVLNSRRTFELWSPNSKQRPFYPGVMNPNHIPGTNSLDRADGHLGRFDATVSPQLFCPSSPWLGYIRNDSDRSYPEFSVAPNVWIPQLHSLSRGGYFDNDYLNLLHDRAKDINATTDSLSEISRIYPVVWDSRPRINNEALAQLEDFLAYGVAVQCLAVAQRSIKHQDAWNRMAADLLYDHNHPQAHADIQVTPAREELMGVWLNGADEAEGLKLIKHRVPCFIISEVSTNADHRRASGERSMIDFVERSSVTNLHRSCNPYDKAALQSGARLKEMDQDVGIATSVPIYSNADYSRASPTVQAAHSKPNAAKEDPAGTLDNSTGELLPPRIEKAKPGEWTYWMQTTMDDHRTPCLERMSEKRKVDCVGARFYDRKRRRHLFFEEEPKLPENYFADPAIWGLPVPRIIFAHRVERMDLAVTNPTDWMYRDEDPVPGDENKAYYRNNIPALNIKEIPSSLKEPVNSNCALASTTAGPPSAPSAPPYRQHSHVSSRYISPGGQPCREPSPCREGTSGTRSSRRSASPCSPRRQESPERQRRRKSKSPSPCRSLAERLAPRRSRSPIARDKGKAKAIMIQHRHSSLESFVSSRRSSSARSMESIRFEDPEQEYVPVQTALAVIESQAADGSTSRMEGIASSSTNLSLIISRPGPEAMESLRELFPPATTTPVRVEETLVAKANSKFLVLWNLPNYYLWQHVIEWVHRVRSLIGNPAIERIIRTNESGFQIFWMKFKHPYGALRFRGLISGHQLQGDEARICCDFVPLDEYNGANGMSSDRWESNALSYNRSLSAPYSDQYCAPAIAGPSLLARLGAVVDIDMDAKKPSRGSRRRKNFSKKLNTADGGARRRKKRSKKKTLTAGVPES